jgi:hypothetical protein
MTYWKFNFQATPRIERFNCNSHPMTGPVSPTWRLQSIRTMPSVFMSPIYSPWGTGVPRELQFLHVEALPAPEELDKTENSAKDFV